MNKKIAITAGDFNGIGPEIIVKALKKLSLSSNEIVLIGAKNLFSELCDKYEIFEVPFDDSWLSYGNETKEAGQFSYACLLKACQLAKDGVVSGIVTAPVSKNALHLAGYSYSGQTEILEEQLADESLNQKAEMLFVCGGFRVLLLTRHLPLSDVKITASLLIEKITRINNVLKTNFGINNAKIALCSFNPHAGENGVLGMDEINEFLPALKKLRSVGIDVSNPFPADALFSKVAKSYFSKEKLAYDVYCACYHDQGLIPVKMLAQDSAVNMTVGLKVVRTSPAHGTAYDIAGKNIADESSMICAIKELL